MSNKKTITTIDCTLRDGGYYNNWDFEPDLVQHYLQAMEDSEVDIVEIGFRFLPQNKFVGAFAYSTDEFLRDLRLPQKAKIGVMINAGEVLEYSDNIHETLDMLFHSKKNSPVSLVRIACHVSEVESSKEIALYLSQLGYDIGLNIMQISRYSNEKIEKVISEISLWDVIDVLYFADSLGNMSSDNVNSIIDLIKGNWNGPIGIHAHDNMGQALTNTVVAIKKGVSWVDATVLGMGRGAGNARMEFLLCELNRLGYSKYNSDALIYLVMEDFKLLHSKYEWGANFLYYISARDDIHPTYVQTMYNELNYDLTHVFGALQVLKDMDGHSYSQDSMVAATRGKQTDGKGGWSAIDWLAGKDVLLLGGGPSIEKYQATLVNYIIKNKLAVLSMNTNSIIPEELITAYIACHPTRIIADIDDYSQLACPLIIPVSILQNFVKERLAAIEHYDYGMSVRNNYFETMGNGCVIPSLVVGAYGLAIATDAGASRIILAGFDGFKSDDYRQAEMTSVFEIYQNTSAAVPLLSITPTNFPVPQSSVFAETI
jgi:4-hydroxy 2-oxovalerate aldolase